MKTMALAVAVGIAAAAQAAPACTEGGQARGRAPEAVGAGPTPHSARTARALARVLAGETLESLGARREGSTERARAEDALQSLRAGAEHGGERVRSIALRALLALGDPCAIEIVKRKARAGEIGTEEAMRHYGRGLGSALRRAGKEKGA